MKVYSLVLQSSILTYMVWQNLLFAVDYVRPGANATYECTISGGDVTVWKGSALGHKCVIALDHDDFETNYNAFASCNNGTVFVRGITDETGNYISQLTILVTPDVNAKMINCYMYTFSQGHGEMRINSFVLHLLLDDLNPPELKCKPHFLGSTGALVRLETTFDKILPFISFSSGVHISVSSYTVTYSDSITGNVCENVTIPESSCDPYYICYHTFEVSRSSCLPTSDINVTVFADSIKGRGESSSPLTRESVNTFVNITYDQTKKVVTCLFQNQPAHIRKTCSAIYSDRAPRRRLGNGSIVTIDGIVSSECSKVVRVEAWSENHPTISVIIDSEDSPCPISPSMDFITVGVAVGIPLSVIVVIVICKIIAVLSLKCTKTWQKKHLDEANDSRTNHTICVVRTSETSTPSSPSSSRLANPAIPDSTNETSVPSSLSSSQLINTTMFVRTGETFVPSSPSFSQLTNHAISERTSDTSTPSSPSSSQLTSLAIPERTSETAVPSSPSSSQLTNTTMFVRTGETSVPSSPSSSQLTNHAIPKRASETPTTMILGQPVDSAVFKKNNETSTPQSSSTSQFANATIMERNTQMYTPQSLSPSKSTNFNESSIISALKEITDPHELGLHLGIEACELDKIEDEQRKTERRKAEVIKYWLRNNSHCSWVALADAVEKMDRHGNLVRRLRTMDSHYIVASENLLS